MATYAIGDIQGCFAPLRRLLSRTGLDARRDRLWLVGDLVNRGPLSLDVLRWARDLGDRVTAVLGNHDLHLLALSEGVSEKKPGDTLDAVLEAPDCDELLAWLGARPLLHREDGFLLVHAGLLPGWTEEEAEARARRAEGALRGPGRAALLRALRADKSESAEGQAGDARLAFDAGVLTRIRTCTREGRLCRAFHGPPGAAPEGCVPWFEARGGSGRGGTIVFGHWAALGLHLAPGLIGLDTGCVWGGALTAYRLEDGMVWQEPAGR